MQAVVVLVLILPHPHPKAWLSRLVHILGECVGAGEVFPGLEGFSWTKDCDVGT